MQSLQLHCFSLGPSGRCTKESTVLIGAKEAKVTAGLPRQPAVLSYTHSSQFLMASACLLLSVSAARTHITNPPQDQSVIKGTKASMTCGVTHDPSVVVRYVAGPVPCGETVMRRCVMGESYKWSQQPLDRKPRKERWRGKFKTI